MLDIEEKSHSCSADSGLISSGELEGYSWKSPSSKFPDRSEGVGAGELGDESTGVWHRVAWLHRGKKGTMIEGRKAEQAEDQKQQQQKQSLGTRETALGEWGSIYRTALGVVHPEVPSDIERECRASAGRIRECIYDWTSTDEQTV